jgi:catechol 2,3-dioxygenase-like lactoylglutathione lyase family enzyme
MVRAPASLLRVTPSPRTNRVGQVFVPVRDMPAAVSWYSALLGLPPGTATHEDRIYDLPVQGDVGLALDAHHPGFTADGPPRFFWWVEDLRAVRDHLTSLGVEPSTDITDIGSVTLLQFRDPDGNLLMACQRNREPEPPSGAATP